mgnify:CR=1 FL=1
MFYLLASENLFSYAKFGTQARVVPETNADLVNFLLDTEAQDIEFEVARCRPR